MLEASIILALVYLVIQFEDLHQIIIDNIMKQLLNFHQNNEILLALFRNVFR